MKKVVLILALVLFVFTLSGVNAEKEPIWQYYSTDPISNVEISEDSINISATHGSKVSLWKNHSSSYYNTKTEGAAISAMDMSSDGKFVVTAVESSTTLKLWEEGTKKWEKDDFTLSLKDAAINSEGTHLAVVAYFDILYFSVSSNEEIWSDNPWADSGDSDEFTTVAISDNHQYIAAGTFGGNVWVYDTTSSDPLWHHSGSGVNGRITDIEFSNDNNFFVIGTEVGKVFIYESASGTQMFEWAQSDEVTCVTAGFDPNYFAFGTETGLVTVLNVEQQFKEWETTIGGEITDIEFNGNAKYLVAGSSNKKLLLANVSDGEELWRISAFGDVNSVAMSYRGENIAVGTNAGLALYYERQLDNQLPIAKIDYLNPTTALPGTPVTMSGSGIDTDGSILSYLWHSSIDGNLSSEANFTISNLSTGYHLISFSVMDNNGRWSKVITINLGIGDFPEASIDSITGCLSILDCVVSEGENIEFKGTAESTASEDTEVVGYQWLSSLDGPLSEEATFSTADLSRGSHLITFRAINDIGFWSSNATANVLINGVPVLSSVEIEPASVVAGENVILFASANDPDDNPLTYIWTSESLFFANGQKLYESSETGSSVVTSDSDIGEKEVYLIVTDSLGASSQSLTITIQILSPPLVSAICDEEATLNADVLFTATASDKGGGRIVLYEWDFNSSNGDIDSVDFKGAEVAVHSYNYTPPDSSYLVVVRVTDDHGLVARDTCTVSIVADTPQSTTDSSSSSGNSLSSVTEIASPPVIIGILLVIVAIGGAIFYMNRKDDSSTYVAPPPKAAPVSGSEFMDSVVPEVSPVKERRVRKRKVVQETMTIECPECSAQMDIPKVSGTQEIQCSECGLEGEIDL